MTLQVTSALFEDLEQVAKLFNLYRMFYKQPSDIDGAKTFIKTRLENRDSQILCARSRNTIVGFAQLYPRFSSALMKKIWILNDLYVDSKTRRIGVGQALLKSALEFAVQTQAVRLTLATKIDNTFAQSLYETNGWIRDNTFYHYNLEVSEK